MPSAAWCDWAWAFSGRFCLLALVELGPEKFLLALELGGLGAELFLIGLGSLEL